MKKAGIDPETGLHASRPLTMSESALSEEGIAESMFFKCLT